MNSDHQIQYLAFRYNWFEGQKPIFNKYLSKYKNIQGLYFLEIGTFEGMASKWMLDNILTDHTSRIMVVDTFEGSDEHKQSGMELSNLFHIFLDNIKGHEDKVDIMMGKSQDVLRLDCMQDCKFDFIYIDGSHRSPDVLTDAILSWKLLKNGGLLAFDDYKWKYIDEIESPGIAIDSFLNIYQKELILIEKNYQVWVQKK